MSENSGSNRWQALSEELGLPPEKCVSENVSKVENNSAEDDFLTFAKPAPRQLEKPQVVIPVPEKPIPERKSGSRSERRPQIREKIVYNDEVLEVTFGSKSPVASPGAEAHFSPPVSVDQVVTSNESTNASSTENSGNDSGRRGSERENERGGRGRNNDRGRGKGRDRNNDRGRSSNSRDENSGASRENDTAPIPRNNEIPPPQPRVSPQRELEPVPQELKEPIAFKPTKASFADDDSFEPETYGEHHPEQDGEIEEIDLSTWNVPSWQELIESLYRPDR